jgi:uncharacterized protein
MKSQSFAGRHDHLLVLDTDDDFLESLIEFVKRNDIQGASFSGIGAFRHAVIAYWNWDSKEYEHIDVPEQVEVLALTGSVARAGEDVKIHAHTVLGRRGGATIGGHLIRASVRPTLEIFIADHGTRLTRRKDDATGLWLLDL